MAEDNHTRLWKLRSRSCGVRLALTQIVDHADHTAASLNLALRRERRQHVIRLNVAMDGVDRREGLKRVERGERREIACVQDQIYIRKEIQRRLRNARLPGWDVSIGDDADAPRCE